MKTRDSKPSELATPTGLRPADFPIGSPHSRAAARKLAEERENLARQREPWRWVTVKMNNLEGAKELARLFRDSGPHSDDSAVRLIDEKTGRKIPF
jgi:hypothetical protein